MALYPANIDVSSLDGTTGFKISSLPVSGIDPLVDGVSVSSGDVNGDGFADLIIGDKYDGGGNGVTYVVFGKAAGFGSFLDLSTLDSSTGFRITHGSALYSGFSVASAGDINGDGFDDILVGDPGAPYAFSAQNSSAYVVFGKATGFADVDLSTLDGSNGFRLSEALSNDETGWSVAPAGDLNGDGFADFVVGSPHSFSPGGTPYAYVVFGKASGFPADLSLASLGSNGIKISGGEGGTGMSVASAGDINGDGFLDLIVGAPSANGAAGAAYVLFGSASGFPSNVDLTTLDGTNGFRLHDSATQDSTGFSVASAGDVNGDGFDDFIIGEPGAEFSGSFSRTFVVFGKASGFPSDFDLNSLNGTNGFKVGNAAGGQGVGWSVASAGDLNGDGFDDIMIGAPGLYGAPGHVYVIYGKASGFAATIDPSSLDGTNGFTLTGGAGDEIGFSVASAGDLNGDGANDLIVGGGGGASYVVYGVPPADPSVNEIGTSKADILKGSQADDNLVGGAGNDRLYGYAGNDVLSGGAGNDVLAGGAGDDVLIGGTGTDTAYYGTEQAGVNASLATDKATGASTGSDTLASIENLTGSSFNDILTGDGGANTLIGLGGNDTLNGGAGADTMIGGTGNDTYYVDNVGDVVTELANEGTDTVKTTLSSYVLGANVENLTFIGTGNFSGTGNGLANTLTGGAGDDTLTGLGGNDRLNGGAGVDVMTGGIGNDAYYVDNSGDQVIEAPGGGTDTVYATASWSMAAGQEIEDLRVSGTQGLSLTGNEFANSLLGGVGNDTLDGGAGNDRLNGGLGIDVMAGGTGNDAYYVDNSGDQVIEGVGEGTDTVYATASWAMAAGQEIEGLRVSGTQGLSLTGNEFANSLLGGIGGDTLNGGAGNDTLNGGGGNDTLDGGAGKDRLMGGAGNDTFVFDTALGPTNVDTVMDFSTAGDSFTLDQAIFTGLNTGTLDASAFSLDSATGSNAQIVYNHTTGALFYDSNGAAAGGSTEFAIVTGAPTLGHTYFTVVAPGGGVSGGSGIL